MIRRLICCLFAALLAIFSISCGKQRSDSVGAKAVVPAAHNQWFQVRGVVQELKPDGKTVVIKHEAVTNYMPAMTMPFEVRDTNELRGLKPGDAIGFQLAVTDSDAWIEHILKLGSPPGVQQPSRLSFQQVRDVDLLAVGDLLPEYHFTNELGEAISTSQLKGQAFAFTFFFTRCPYPAFCPLLTANFSATERALRAMTNAPANWRLISISFDTDVDTPETLKAYAQSHDYHPDHWSFVTGDLAEITAIGDQVGAYFGHDESGGITHNLRTVVVDARGRVQKIYPNNKWTSGDLVAELVKAAGVKP